MVMKPETKLIKQAIKLKKENGSLSIPYLQRKLKLSYDKAKWVIDCLKDWHD